jgi:hypothetical protein
MDSQIYVAQSNDLRPLANGEQSVLKKPNYKALEKYSKVNKYH